MTTSPELSAQNQKVLALLLAEARPLSAYDILGKLQRFGLRSPPTVYRALEQLMQRGLVHRLESLNAFVACQHHESSHTPPCRAGSHASPFAICTQCGMVREIEDSSLAKLVKKLGAPFLARVDKKVFELSGLCHACAQRGDAVSQEN